MKLHSTQRWVRGNATKFCAALFATMMLVPILLVSFASSAKAAVSTVNLGAAAGYAVLAGAAFTEGANNDISGETIFGVAGSASGPGSVASAAFADAGGRTATSTSGASSFGTNRTLTAGVHKFTSYVSMTGNLTLDGENDPNAVFIFQVGGYLTTEAGFEVDLENGANAANVFWQVDTYFSPGASTEFKGTVLAGTYITTGADLDLDGRLFAIGGAVTTGANNTINKPASAATTTTTSTTTTVPAARTMNVELGSAASYSVLAGAAVTTGSHSAISGNIIANVAGAASGPGSAASAAYADAAGRTAKSTTGANDFPSNRTLTAGVYKYTSFLAATGTLTLDAENDSNAVFIFQIDGYLSTQANFQVQLINGTKASNVFWQVDSYFLAGASTDFKGTILAGSYITTGADLHLDGRLFAFGGAVTTGANTTITTTYSLTAQTVTWNPTLAISTITSPYIFVAATTSGNGSVNYVVTSAGTTGCLVNSTTRTLTYVAAGSCVVTVTFDATSSFAAGTNSKTFIITDSSSAPTTNTVPGSVITTTTIPQTPNAQPPITTATTSTTTTVPRTITTTATTIPQPKSGTTSTVPPTTVPPTTTTTTVLRVSSAPIVTATSDGGAVMQMQIPQAVAVNVGVTPQASALVKVIVPPIVNSENLVWDMSISDRSNQAVVESQSATDSQSATNSQLNVDVGYLTVAVTAKTSSGQSVTALDAPIQISLPKAPPVGSVVAWSRDDITWTAAPQLLVPALSVGQQDGYFIEADGTVTFFSRHLTSFGIRKLQQPLELTVAKFDIVSGSVSRAVPTGGTSEDPVRYQSMSDPSVCTVTDTGLIYGLSAGTCTVYVTRGGGSIYMDTTSRTIDAKVVGAITPLVPAVGHLALAVQLAVLVAMFVLLATLGRRLWITILSHRSHNI